MLFEMFFDSQGNYRENPKVNVFDEVFDLEQYPELMDSFDFIASALVPMARNFYVVPGKGKSLSVDVHLTAAMVIESIFIAGSDVLLKDFDPFEDEDEDTNVDDNKVLRRSMKQADFESELTQQILVPRRLLTIKYNRTVDAGVGLKIAYGMVAGRPS